MEPAPRVVDHEDLLARLADVIYALDTDGRFTYVNHAGAALFGWSADELIGQHFAVVIAPEALEAAREHFERGLQWPGSSPFFETRIRRPDGEERELEVHAGSVIQDGRIIGRQGVARDITELRRIQADLAEKTSRLTLVEEQQRVALDLYRRLTLMAGRLTSRPGEAERALTAVENMMQTEIGRTAGLDEVDLSIIRLVADGHTNKEIADIVHLSAHTVKDRVGRIITRLGARGRAAVGTRAAELGLLQP